jgi:PAS domain-containing protein
VDWTVCTGDPARGIVSSARQYNSDLVVMGTRSLTGLRRLMLGSVARNVVTHAHCSVLSCRPRTERGTVRGSGRPARPVAPPCNDGLPTSTGSAEGLDWMDDVRGDQPGPARSRQATRARRPDQLPIELILLRQAASYLSMPIFLVDDAGRLIYYNEPAESLLGSSFDEVGEMDMADWLAAFRPSGHGGARLSPSAVPLVKALRSSRAVHSTLQITGLDGVRRPIEVTALPLRGQAGKLLGAIAVFWPSDDQ